MGDIAVLIPCRDHGPYLEEALESVLHQSLQPTEVLVLDDGSQDDSAARARRWMRERSTPAGWRVCALQRLGLHHALTEGIARSTSPWIARLDADDVLQPHFLKRLHEVLLANPHAGYAYPAMRLFGMANGRYHTLPYDPARLVMEGNFVSACALFKREAYETTRGLADLRAWEDWDLWLSFLESGWPGVLVDEELYLWRRHVASRNTLTLLERRRMRALIWWRHRRLVARYALPGSRYALRRALNPLGQQ